MIYFDFLYYLIYKFYSNHREKGAQSTAAGIIGGFQVVNVLTVGMAIAVVRDPKIIINKILVIILFLVFQVTTYIRYIYKDSNSVEVIEKKWLSKNESWRSKATIWFFLYGSFSIIAFFGLAIYLGSLK